MAWDADGKQRAYNEDIITSQVFEILESIQISRDAISEIIDHLKGAKEQEMIFHQRAVSDLQDELAQAERRKQALLNLFLDGRIDDATFNAKDGELKSECLTLRNKISLHQQGDDKVNDTIVKVFRAAARTADGFIASSEVPHRRGMIKSIFRTLVLRDGILCYDLKFPFNEFAKMTKKEDWRTCKDSNPESSHP